MKWFGLTWNASVNRDYEECPVPSAPCALCEKAFSPQDRGLVLPFVGSESDPPELGYHLDCFGASIGIMDPGASVTVGQTWQYQRLVPRVYSPIVHEIVAVDGNYVESVSVKEDGTRRQGVVLSGPDGAGLRFMLAGGDEVGSWKLLREA